MRWVLLILLMILLSSPLQAHTFYKWVDEKGVVNFTDDYNSIPPAHRDRIEIQWVHEEGSSPVQKMAPQKGDQTRTDIYGRNEAYWRDKVRPWNKFLKVAEGNYDKAHEKFMEKAMELSRMRFGSRTQYKMNIIELDNAKDEMVKYADQITEAKEALEKISKEAREEKANPDWLK